MLKKLLRRASGVAIGTAAGQGLILLSLPQLARRYSPEEFGLLALLVTIGNISTAVACFRYDFAIPSSQKSDVRGLLGTAMVWAGSSGLVTAMLVAILPHFEWLRLGGVLFDHPILIGVCIVLIGMFQAASAWLLHRGSFHGVAWLRFSQGAAFSLLAFFPVPGLSWAHALSFFGGLIVVREIAGRRQPHEARWTDVARRYRQFPLMSLPGALLDVCGYSMCIWVIDSYYGHAVVGNYSQVQRLTGAPLMLLSISLGQVLLKQTAEQSGNLPALRSFLVQLLQLLMGVSLVGLVLIWFAGEPLFHWILGPQWSVDRHLIILAALAVFVRACVSPLSSVLVTLNRFKLSLTWQILYFFSAAVVMPFVAARTGFKNFMLFYAMHEVVFYCFYLALIFRSLEVEPKKLFFGKISL